MENNPLPEYLVNAIRAELETAKAKETGQPTPTHTGRPFLWQKQPNTQLLTFRKSKPKLILVEVRSIIEKYRLDIPPRLAQLVPPEALVEAMLTIPVELDCNEYVWQSIEHFIGDHYDYMDDTDIDYLSLCVENLMCNVYEHLERSIGEKFVQTHIFKNWLGKDCIVLINNS